MTLALGSVASAQSTWNTTGGNWNVGANWSPTGAPVSDSSNALFFGGGTSYTTTNNLGTFQLNQLTFTNTGGTITLNGSPTTNALQFVSARDTTAPTLTLTGNGNATVSAPINWNASTAITNSGTGTLTLSGAQTFTNGTKHTYTNSSTGILTLTDGVAYANTGSGSGLVLNLINNNDSANTFNIGDLGGLTNVTFNIGGTGTVRFNGSPGDLFIDTMVLNVQAGATFDFNGNAETMGAISGGGTIRQTLGISVNPSASTGGYHVFSGMMTGTGGFLELLTATETLVLSGSLSDYTGSTTVTGGRMIIAANAPNGSAGALGNATSDVLVGHTTGTGTARLLIGSPDVNIGRNIRFQSGNTGLVAIGGINTSGTATYSGNIILGTDNAAAKGAIIQSAKGGTVEFTGNLLRAASATGVTDTLTINGGGTVVLAGSNTFTGTTAVNGGTLVLDHTTNNDSKLSATAALTLSGGSLSVIGSNTASTAQAVNGLAVGNASAPLGGGARITVTSGAGQGAVLALGAITKNAGGTVDFVPVDFGGGTASITTTTANTSANILGAYATFKQNDWAVRDGSGSITSLAAGSYTASFGAGLHTSRSASFALPSGGATTNTLRLTAAAAITFNATPGALTLESGGILVAATAGTTSIGTTGLRGSIATVTSELIIHQQSTTGTLTIHSIISGNNVTKSGDGILVLTGTNTYTGNTIINGGTVSVTAAANLGEVTSDIIINGGTLALPSGTLGTLNSTNRVITVGQAGATFNFTANQSLQGNGLTGTGTLTLAGSGILSVGTNASNFSGDIVINNGVLKMNSQQFNSVPSLTVNSGGTYEVNDDGTGTFGVTTGGRILINGNGMGGNGAIRLTDQGSGSAFLDPKTTISNEVVLQSNARIQVDNGTAAGSLSQLTLAGNVTGAGNLTKAGNGTLVLSARDNSFSGNISVDAGTLSLNLGDNRLPTSTLVNLGAGTTSGTLQLNGYSQTLQRLTTTGTGTSNTVIGGSAASTSLLRLDMAAGTESYGGTLGGNGVANTHANNNLNFSKGGTGTLVLEKAHTHHGVTNVEQGTLVLGHASALGNGGASLSAGTGGTFVQAGATLDLYGKINVQEVITLNGPGTAFSGALVNNSATAASIGSGVSSLSVSGVTTTGWSVASTAVSISPPASGSAASATAQLGLGTGSLSLTGSGGGYGLAPVVTVSGGTGAVVIASMGVTSATYTVTPNTTTYSVAPNVTLQNGATGVANLNGSGQVVSITVTNPGSGFGGTPTATFSGGTVLTAGTAPTAAGNNNNYVVIGLNIVNPGTGFTSVPTVTIAAGTGGTATAVANDGSFVLNGIAVTDNGSGYTSAPTVSINGGTASATANLSEVKLATDSSVGGSGDLTIHALVSGTGALTKVGGGVTTLTGNNTYTGTTTVSEGTLQVGVGGVGKSGTGAMFLNGATAVLAGTGSIENSTTVMQGIIRPGDNGGLSTGTLNMKSLAFLPATSTTVMEMQIVSNASFDVLNITGDVTLTSNSNIFVNGSGYTAAVGDSFTLLDWSGLVSVNGFNTGSNLRTGNNAAGDEGNLDLPDITGTGLWQISELINGGALTLTVIAVPEPARGMLVLIGGVVLMTRCRRGRA